MLRRGHQLPSTGQSSHFFVNPNTDFICKSNRDKVRIAFKDNTIISLVLPDVILGSTSKNGEGSLTGKEDE